MDRIRDLVRRFVREEDGLELVEYALMAAVLVAVVLFGIYYLWKRVESKYEETGSTIETPAEPTTDPTP